METPAPVPRSSPGVAAAGPIRTRATPQGAIYLWTIGLFSLTILALGENLVFLLGTLVLGCGAVTYLLARRNLVGVRVERTLPAVTRVGLPTPLEWTVRAGARRPVLGLEVEDRPARGLRPVCLQVEFPCVERGQAARLATQVVFGRRGRVDLAARPLVVSSRFPLGLFRAEATVPGTGSVLVRPAEGRLTARLRERLRGRREDDVRRRRVQPGRDVIYGVREFRPGDDPGRIHWRTTARRGALVLSEWRTEQGREVVIVLGRARGAGPQADAAFERAVSTAATLWRAAAREPSRTRLLLGGPAAEPVLRDGGRGLGRGLDALALVGAQGRRHPRRALAALRRMPGSRTVIYVACGEERGLDKDLRAAAGPAGAHVLLRADRRSLRTWIGGLA